ARRLLSPNGPLRAPPRAWRTTTAGPGSRFAARRIRHQPPRGGHCLLRRRPVLPPPRRPAPPPTPPPPARHPRAVPPRRRRLPTRQAALRPGTPSRPIPEAPVAFNPRGPALAAPGRADGPGQSASRPPSHRKSRTPRGHWILVSLVMLVFAAGLLV